MSHSPDQRVRDGPPNNKVVAVKAQNSSKDRLFNNTSYSNYHQPVDALAKPLEFENQLELKNYLNQIQQNEQ